MTSNHEFMNRDGCIWCPIFTLSRNEKKLQKYFESNGIISYLPLKKVVKVQPVISKGKQYMYKRELTVPMFSNYIFASLNPFMRTELRYQKSVVNILDISPCQEKTLLDELNVIRKLEIYSEENNIKINPTLSKGMRVRFIDGVFVGSEGVVLDDEKGDMVRINITSIQSSATIHYPTAWCEKIIGK